MDPAIWDRLRRAITLYGGDPADLAGIAGGGRKSEVHSAMDIPWSQRQPSFPLPVSPPLPILMTRNPQLPAAPAPP